MFAKITCPTCSHKFAVPEGSMGKRQSCPNCNSSFVAGASTADPVEKASAPPPPASLDKTMLAGTGPSIKFNCPRCQKPIEAPVSAANTKMPCPSCGQRLQVPAAPAASPAPAPHLNKTMLVDTSPPIRYNCPSCKKPLESPASEALTKKPCPACGQRIQVPAASPAAGGNQNKTMLASAESVHPSYAPGTSGSATAASPQGTTVPASQPANAPLGVPMQTWKYGAGAIALLFLLVIVVPAFVRGGKSPDLEKLAELQKELERTKLEALEKKSKFDEQKRFEETTKMQLDGLLAKLQAAEDRMRERYQQDINAAIASADLKRKAELEERRAQDERKLAQERLEHEKTTAKMLKEQQDRTDELKKQLDAANQKQQSQQTVIQERPPVVIHSPWHYRYYYPWWY